MGLITTLTRMWLMRSTRPFIFRNDNDSRLSYSHTEDLGLYVHIPFCRRICGFCPYCKTTYERALCDAYIDALIDEIRMVGGMGPEGKKATSLYFGGGTPALAAGRMKEVIDAIGSYFSLSGGIGTELHPDDVTVPVLETLKDAGVTKISIGVQSFRSRYQKILGRRPVDAGRLGSALARVPFETVSMDFIFALPGQTFDDLRTDIETAFSHGANHIAMYPFIDFAFTGSTIPPMRKGEKRGLLDAVTRHCEKKGYRRGSIWTFSSQDNASYSSMTRDNYLGFGCSAATLLENQFKINTFSIKDYCQRIRENKLPTSLTLRFTPRQRMIYHLFWTAYTTRIDKKAFEHTFGRTLKDVFGIELGFAKLLGLLKDEGESLRLTPKGVFYFHYYEQFYTLAYIDKMWGLLSHEAFPQELVL